MHAHQSKAPRATLQHTHTYSTNSTAGTDQFIPDINRLITENALVVMVDGRVIMILVLKNALHYYIIDTNYI